MTTTNHTSPSGEEAANGAMGERASLCDRIVCGHAGECVKDDAATWLKCPHVTRAALTAEKVAAEPVDFVFPPMPPAIVMHDKLGPLFDRLSMHFYAYKCMTSAAPQQPAQSAEQDERAASPTDDEIIEDATEAFGRSREYSNCFGEPSERSLVHFVRKYMARAASTQSTATQPVQTQVALTDEQVMSVSIINGEVTDYKYAGNLLDGEYPLYVVRHLTEGQAASILAAALRFETEGNKPMANDMRALLAAQPADGGKS